MIKRYLYAGIIVLVVGALLLYLVSSYVASGTPTNMINVTVPGGRIGDVPIEVNAIAVSVMFVFASSPTDIYFLNQSEFSGLSGYLSGYPSRSAYGYLKSQNVSSDDISLNATSAVSEDYQKTVNLSAQNYYVYAVIDSTDGSPSSNSVVNASVVYKSYSYGSWEQNSGESLVGLAAIILGVGLLIYGALKKPKFVAQADNAVVESPKTGKKIKG